jgi:hypothetical protein
MRRTQSLRCHYAYWQERKSGNSQFACICILVSRARCFRALCSEVALSNFALRGADMLSSRTLARTRVLSALTWTCLPALAAISCATSATREPSGKGGTEEGNSNLPVFGEDAGAGVFGAQSCSPCEDFPSAPIFDDGVPSDAPTLFGAPESGQPSGGPCLAEPEMGSLFPSNWLRPRFRLVPTPGETLFEIRLHADIETNDLVVYTKSKTWTMPKTIWTALAAHVVEQPITVTVRGSDGTQRPARGTQGTFTIAPVPAGGSMVYWATTAFDSNAQNTKLQGFRVGDETFTAALTTPQVQQKVRATWGAALKDQTTQVQCIGCHTSTPDGKYAAFTAQWPWPNALASVVPGNVGAAPDFMTPAAISAMSPNSSGAYSQPEVQKMMLGIQTYSKAHWKPGDRIAVTTRGSAWYRENASDPGGATGVVAELVWFDLEARSEDKGVAWDVIARQGDTRSAVAPSFSHDGTRIAYASTDTGAEDGRMGKGASDVAIVSYANRAGGASKKLTGASEGVFEEYYPAFSADDSLIAFNRVSAGNTMYNQPLAEVYVVPSTGGSAERLKANDPVACSGRTSPGVQNTWPKWSPVAKVATNGKTYHWLIFSSTRGGTRSQLYATAVVQEGSALTTYPAIYLWNQDETSNNLVPAWDVFEIPVIAPR